MKAGAVLVLFGVCAASLVVASGTASPVVFGIGEATPPVAATGVLSSLIALISGGGGIWALLKAISPQAGKVISVLDPFVNDKKIVDGASEFVQSIFGGKLDAATLSEEAALLFVSVCRVKAGDADGKDQAFALLQHIREQNKTLPSKK